MAVTSKSLRSVQQARRPVVAAGRGFRALAYGVTLLLAAVAVYAVVGALYGYLQTGVDDLRYGRPRTVQLEGYVGHNEAPGRPTHLIGLNLNRQITLIELPGGDATQARTYLGPYLVGAREDLTPVSLALSDVDGDGASDLLVSVRDEQIVYLNRDGAFRPATAEEQAQLRAEGQP